MITHSTNITNTFYVQLLASFETLQEYLDNPSQSEIDLATEFEKTRNLVLSLCCLPLENQHEILKAFASWNSYFRLVFQDIEGKMELHVARSFLQGTYMPDSYITSVYKHMAMYELQVMRRYVQKMNPKILFVGSGPFPFSPIQMSLLDPSLHIDLLDQDNMAVFISQLVLGKLGLASKLTVLPPTSVETFSDISKYDAIFIAAMVGTKAKDKIEIYKKIAANIPSNTVLITRTANPFTCSTLAYAPFPFEKLSHLYAKERMEHMGPNVVLWSTVLRRR